MNDLTPEQYLEMLSGLAAKNTQNELVILELRTRLNAALRELQQAGADTTVEDAAQ